jgi:hypothetical protein
MSLEDYIKNKDDQQQIQQEKDKLYHEYTESDGKIEGLLESAESDFEKFLILKESFNSGLKSIHDYLKKTYKGKLNILKNKTSIGVFDLLTEPVAEIHPLGNGFLIKYADGKSVEAKDDFIAKAELTKYFRTQL